MGIVVLSLAILPMLGVGGQSLFNAEVPGVKTHDDQLTPRIASTAKILFMVYFALTLMETILLWLGGMHFFDAVCHSFSTIATGGFSTKNNSIAYYNSSYIQVVITVFMFLSGCNFILHYRALKGLPLKQYLSEEYRFFAGILITVTLIITVTLLFSHVTDPMSGEKYHMSPWLSLQMRAGISGRGAFHDHRVQHRRLYRLAGSMRHAASRADLHGSVRRFHRRRHEMRKTAAVLEIQFFRAPALHLPPFAPGHQA